MENGEILAWVIFIGAFILMCFLPLWVPLLCIAAGFFCWLGNN